MRNGGSPPPTSLFAQGIAELRLIPAHGRSVISAIRRDPHHGFCDLARATQSWLSLLTTEGCVRAELDEPSMAELRGLIDRVDAVSSHPLQAGFEGQSKIAGCVYRCSKLGGPSDAAMIKLHFDQGAVDLPVHIHPLSARALIVTNGHGRFHYSDLSFEKYRGQPVQSDDIRAGSVIIFNRGYLHTFSAPAGPLAMLSFHFPFIELEDERQWSLPEKRLLPRDMG